METNIWNFDHSETFPVVTWFPTKNLGPIGSAVLAFNGYKQTDRHPDKPNSYIDFGSFDFDFYIALESLEQK